MRERNLEGGRMAGIGRKSYSACVRKGRTGTYERTSGWMRMGREGNSPLTSGQRIEVTIRTQRKRR